MIMLLRVISCFLLYCVSYGVFGTLPEKPKQNLEAIIVKDSLLHTYDEIIHHQESVLLKRLEKPLLENFQASQKFWLAQRASQKISHLPQWYFARIMQISEQYRTLLADTYFSQARLLGEKLLRNSAIRTETGMYFLTRLQGLSDEHHLRRVLPKIEDPFEFINNGPNSTIMVIRKKSERNAEKCLALISYKPKFVYPLIINAVYIPAQHAVKKETVESVLGTIKWQEPYLVIQQGEAYSYYGLKEGVLTLSKVEAKGAMIFDINTAPLNLKAHP